jgi:hypothetical protein
LRDKLQREVDRLRHQTGEARQPVDAHQEEAGELRLQLSRYRLAVRALAELIP